MLGEDDTISVLHVDDEPDLADMAATFLEREDDRFDIETATNVDDGLNLVSDSEFDCIISDYDMPGQNGIEFLEAVRENHPDLPFILYTGKGSEEVAADAISAGVTDYLQKKSGTDQYTILANRIRNAVSARQSAAEVEQSQYRLEQILKTVPSCVVQLDSEGHFVFANDRAVEVLGLEETALTDRTYNDPEWKITDLEGNPIPDAKLPFRQVRDSGEPLYGFRHAIEWPDGTQKILEVNGEPLFDGAGNVETVVFSLTDITEQWKRKDRLQQTTARLQALFNNSPDMINVHDIDGNIIDPNQRLCDETGYDEAELRGMKVWELDKRIDSQEAHALWEGMTAGDQQRREGVYQRRDGSEFPVEVHIRRLNVDGDDRFMVISRDITEQKEREQQREMTIGFLRSLYDVATDGTLDIDEKITRLLELGPEKLGLPPGHLTRIEVSDEMPETGTQMVIETSGNHELLQPGNSCLLSDSYCRKTIKTDGVVAIQDALTAGWGGDPAYELFDLGCYIGTMVTVDGDLYGTVFFASKTPREVPFTDVDRMFVRLVSRLVSYELERDHARQALERQNEQLEEFVSIVSHDLRNPLQVAEGRLELAREEGESDHLDTVDDALTRSQALIDELLTLAREGDEATDLEPVNLGTLTEECWQNVATAESSIVKNTEQTIKADRNRLQQLFENLYRNAIEHGGDDVTVTVGDLTDGFYIEDDGPGIPDEDTIDVFDAGYSTSDEGIGFGLYIVKQIVEAHDWNIRVNTSKDGGARFEITGIDCVAE